MGQVWKSCLYMHPVAVHAVIMQRVRAPDSGGSIKSIDVWDEHA